MWPEWWEWRLSFTGHAERRMEERGVSEIEVRAMLQHASGHSPSIVAGRFMIETRHSGRPWIVVVEPDLDQQVLAVVTVYGVER